MASLLGILSIYCLATSYREKRLPDLHPVEAFILGLNCYVFDGKIESPSKAALDGFWWRTFVYCFMLLPSLLLAAKACSELATHNSMESQCATSTSESIASEARQTSFEANRCYDFLLESRSVLPSLLSEAQRSLAAAQRGFARRSFLPFWESVDAGVALIQQYECRVKQVSQQAEQLRSLLTGRSHNFPAPPPIPIASQYATDLAAGFSALVEDAFCDHHFTDIYMQKRTQQCITKGFGKLSDLIEGLSGQISSALDDLPTVLDGLSEEIRDGASRVASTADLGSQRIKEQLASDANEQKVRDAELKEILDRIYGGRNSTRSGSRS